MGSERGKRGADDELVGSDYGHALAAIRLANRQAENWRQAADKVDAQDPEKAARFRRAGEVAERTARRLQGRFERATWRCRICGAEVESGQDSEPRTVCEHSFGWNYAVAPEPTP